MPNGRRSPSFLPSVCAAGVVLAIASCGPSAAVASPPVAPTEALPPAEQRAKFRLPAGFEIQLVASEPQIQKPMNMAFDAAGRLWVTHSVEYPFAAAEGTTPRDGLTILEGIGLDGRATKARLFADGLNIPIGVLPLPRGPDDKGDSAIVWSIPHIWKLADTDGDGKADHREVLYGPFDYADTHGNQNAFRLGPDGWVYACHGFRNASQVKLRGTGDVVATMTSGHTYRFRPDGSAIEKLTAGQVNPFGMCFDGLGNRFNADCHSKPITMLLRGGCYESFGKPHDGLGFAPDATADAHGSTGIAGMVVYEGDAFPTDYRGSAFVGNVITNMIHRDRLTWRGSSPWVEKPEEFLACDDWWFRPVDLQLGPDGAVYIADFYNCIIGHYEVDLKHPRRDRTRGRIWRVVWTGGVAAGRMPPPAVPDLSSADLSGLLAALAAPNLCLRRLASEEIVARFATEPAAVDELRTMALTRTEHTADATHRRAAAVLTLARLGRLDDDTAARLSDDPARDVRVHLVRSLDESTAWSRPRADLVRGRLADADPFVQRAAAETLAAHPEPASVAALLRAWGQTPADDTHLVHALRIAVRRQLEACDPAALASLSIDDADWLRLADVAVTIPQEMFAWLAFTAAREHGAGGELLGRCFAGVAEHCGADQLDEAARFARGQCAADDIGGQAGLYRPLFDGWGRRDAGMPAGAELEPWGRELAGRVLAVATVAGAKLVPSPSAVSLALDIAKRLRLVALGSEAAVVVADPRSPVDVREVAAATALALDRQVAMTAIQATLLDGSQPERLRLALVGRLGADDSEEARAALVAALPTAPAALQQPIAVALAGTPAGAEQLLATVTAGKASARLLQDKRVRDAVLATKLPDAGPRLDLLVQDLSPADAEIQALIARVAADHAKRSPEPEKGAAVFRRVCATCHRFDGAGAAIGPQLDGVGQRGPQRLLEDILDPNRNVDEAFRTTTVTTTDGRVVSGMRLRDEGGDLVLADVMGREVRTAAADVEELTVARLSPMPTNIAEQVGEQDLPALLDYLLRRPAVSF